MIRVAMLTTDSREHFKQYDRFEPYFGTAPEALLQGLSSLGDIEVHVVSCFHQPVKSAEKLAANTWFHGLLVPNLGWLRSGYQGCIRAVRRKLRAIRPDLVHAQGTERDCAMSGAFSGYPNLLTIHGNMRQLARISRSRPFTYCWLMARLEGLVLPRFDGVVCITNHTREQVRAKARRTWVLPNAVDALFFEVNAAPEGKPTLLCVGTICANKNQIQLIRALDPLAKAGGFRLMFLGGLDEDTYGQEFLHLVEQRSWCRYGGFADRAALRKTLSSAAMLVLPSLEDNCPMVVLEAMAAGVPVLAAKVGGVPDLIKENETGLFCDPHDATTILGGVKQVLDNPAFGRQLACRAKENALRRFLPAVIARQHVEIYREVLQTAS
jgi:glycosyltransferase involved in cell wall biosynthesis